MPANRCYAFASLALGALVLTGACVNLTPPDGLVNPGGGQGGRSVVGGTTAASGTGGQRVVAGTTAAGGAGGATTGGTGGVDTGGVSSIDTGGAGGAGGASSIGAGGAGGANSTGAGGVGGANSTGAGGVGGTNSIGSGGKGGVSTGGRGTTSAGGTGGTAIGGAAGTRTGGAGGTTTTGGAGGTATGGTTPTGGNSSPVDAAVPSDVRPPSDVAPPVDVTRPPDPPMDGPAVPDVPQVPDLPPDGPVVTPGLVLYYSCDQINGTTLPDLSGNARNGTLVGPVSIGPGKVGNALVFTASNNVDSGTSGGYVVMPPALLSASPAMTIATWFKINSNPAFQRIFDIGGVGGTGAATASMYLTPNGNTGHLQFTIRMAQPDGGTFNREDITDGTPTTMSTGVWWHVAVVLDAFGGRLYLNGALVGSNTTMAMRPPTLGATPNDWIGRSEFAVNPYLDGAIDELRIYSRGLNPAEISALYTFAGH